ncbi:MAG: hypothetical protein O7G31_05330 [Calditrichaeota bacterium]|nr:hypothetical protein [Calditrichota bacterium]
MKNQRLHFVSISIGTSLILLGFFLLLAHSMSFGFFLDFSEKHFSPDHDISEKIKLRLGLFVYYLGFLSLLTGVATFGFLNHDFSQRVKGVLKNQANNLRSVQSHSLFLVTSTGGLFLTLMFVLFYSGKASFLTPLYIEDGLWESLTAGGLAIAAFFMGKSALSLKKVRNRLSTLSFVSIFAFYVIVTMFFFALAMEEISWGQRIFGWQTPSFWASVNEQNETSIHNISFLANVFDILQLLTATILIPILLSAWLKIARPQNTRYLLVLPEPAMLVLAVLIGAAALTFQGELLEELMALFFVLYSMRILKYINSQNNALAQNKIK